MNDSRGDVPNLTADPALAERELGFKADADLTAMCRDLWNWQHNNQNGYATAEPASGSYVDWVLRLFSRK